MLYFASYHVQPSFSSAMSGTASSTADSMVSLTKAFIAKSRRLAPQGRFHRVLGGASWFYSHLLPEPCLS